MGANLPIGQCSRNSSPRDPKVISRDWPSSSVAINRSLLRFHSLNTSAVCVSHSVAQSEIHRSSRVELALTLTHMVIYHWGQALQTSSNLWLHFTCYLSQVRNLQRECYSHRHPGCKSVTVWFCILKLYFNITFLTRASSSWQFILSTSCCNSVRFREESFTETPNFLLSELSFPETSAICSFISGLMSSKGLKQCWPPFRR